MKLVRVIIIAGAVGFALPASTALAQANAGAKPQTAQTQTAQTQGGKAQAPKPPAQKTQGAKAPADKNANLAAAAKPASVTGVEVQATGRSKLSDIPPEKRAAFDAEVAKANAWKRYRQGMPYTNTSVIDQAKDYPGVQALLPEP